MDKLLLKDYLVSRVISFNKTVDDDAYGKIYYKTNEDLLDAYLDVDFYNKDVLSVLGSSDQVFTARYLGAKNVDAFDKNRLSRYYYYLRIWTIKYANKLYPNIGDDFLETLLMFVSPETQGEKEAYAFYKEHVKKATDMRKMFYDVYAQPDGETLFKKADDLKDCISPKLNFEQMDLFEEKHPKKAYDIVIISNILDWARFNKDKLEVAAFNLNKLTNNNGYIIGSNLIARTDEAEKVERNIMGEYFELDKKYDKSYVYRKK